MPVNKKHIDKHWDANVNNDYDTIDEEWTYFSGGNSTKSCPVISFHTAWSRKLLT